MLVSLNKQLIEKKIRYTNASTPNFPIFVFMSAEKYIQDLLFRYECVIIPGFGALIAQRKPAEIHESTHAFYPPRKVVSFNRQLVKNDGLLANYIAESEKISFETALQKVHAFTEQLKKALSEEKEITLDQIGTFQMSADDKLQFQPFYHQNYLSESFGLSSFTSPKIKREEYKRKAEELEEKTGLVFTHEKKEKPVHKYLKVAAIGLIALGLSGFLGMNWYAQQIETQNIAAQQTAEDQLEGKIQKATFVIGNPLPEVIFKIAVQPANYHIVAGAFREESNAEKKTQQLREKGFQARQIGQNKWGLYQVVYCSFQDKSKSLEALRKIKRTDNEAAWLLVQEL